METRADRLRHFAESLEQTRKMLALKDMNYGNVVIRQVVICAFLCDWFVTEIIRVLGSKSPKNGYTELEGQWFAEYPPGSCYFGRPSDRRPA